MMVDALKHPVTHKDRPLSRHEEVNGPLQMLPDRATTNGWGALEIISAMEQVLKNLRLAYAERPDPAEDPPTDSGDANDFGAFPSADRLVKAFVDEREKP